MTYKEIKKNYQYCATRIYVDYICTAISPLVTMLFLKLKLIPNQITGLMMLSGLIGAITFAFDNIWCKVIGLIFIYLWYILDCSDGEVARITKRFSLVGKEIDFVAHVLNHPFFNLAFAISMIQLGRYNTTKILFIFLGLISANLMFRNMLLLEQTLKERTEKNTGNTNGEKKITLRYIIIEVWANFVLFPNFVLTFPVFYLIDVFYNTNICMYYVYVVLIASTLMVLLKIAKWVKKALYI